MQRILRIFGGFFVTTSRISNFISRANKLQFKSKNNALNRAYKPFKLRLTEAFINRLITYPFTYMRECAFAFLCVFI